MYIGLAVMSNLHMKLSDLFPTVLAPLTTSHPYFTPVLHCQIFPLPPTLFVRGER